VIVAAAALGLPRVAGAVAACATCGGCRRRQLRFIDRRVRRCSSRGPWGCSPELRLTISPHRRAHGAGGTTNGKGAGFLDALFTSTSAVCVTG